MIVLKRTLSDHLGGNGFEVYRARRRGVFIHFHDGTMNNTRIFSIDCHSTFNVIYLNDTIIMSIQYRWISDGHFYYITLDSGLSFSIE